MNIIDKILQDADLKFAVQWDRRLHKDDVVAFHQRNIDALLTEAANAGKPESEALIVIQDYIKGIPGVSVVEGQEAIRQMIKDAQGEEGAEVEIVVQEDDDNG